MGRAEIWRWIVADLDYCISTYAPHYLQGKAITNNQMTIGTKSHTYNTNNNNNNYNNNNDNNNNSYTEE